jgi:hypothetical protein
VRILTFLTLTRMLHFELKLAKCPKTHYPRGFQAYFRERSEF